MATLEGHTLNNQYYLRSSIGSGGMADVYLAWDSIRSTQMAIKVLRRDWALNRKFINLFRGEAETLRKLDHPNIVRIYDFDKANNGDIVFLVMDWIEGSSLKDQIERRKKPFTLQEVSKILQPLSSALYYAHQMQVVHCDIKPANVLIRKDGQVFLTDFGVARHATEIKHGGTPWYMAYEQFTSGRVDSRTDVYSLAVTVYEMLSGGKLPYPGNPESKGSTAREKIEWEQTNLPLPPIKQFNRSVPSSVDTMLAAALSLNPQDRFENTTKMYGAFELAKLEGDRGGSKGTTSIYVPDQTEQTEKPSRPISEPRIKATRRKPKIFCQSGEYQGRSFDIPKDGLRIGRFSKNTLRISERSVSRWHAVIYVIRQGTFIRDETSALGTFVNGQQISEPTHLKHGDVIQIGFQQVFEYRER